VNQLKELKNAQLSEGEHLRRWFGSPEMDLVVWYGRDETPVRFELYYDKMLSEHVFIWRKQSGIGHMAVDDGEQKPAPHHKETPILVPDGQIDVERIRTLFERSSTRLPAALRDFVRRKIVWRPQG